MMIFKKPQRTPKIPQCKENPKIPVVINTTYVLTLTQITLTHIDLKKQLSDKSLFSTFPYWFYTPSILLLRLPR